MSERELTVKYPLGATSNQAPESWVQMPLSQWETLLQENEQQIAAQRRLVANLRDRLARCQEHNRQAAREVRRWEAEWHRMAIASAKDVADFRQEFAQRAEQAEADLQVARAQLLQVDGWREAAEAERDAARAGLGRAVDVVRDLHAECCMPWVTVVRDQYTLRMQPVLKRAEQICADPLGQQALAEWRHLKTVAGHVLKVKADGWYFSDPELAAAVEALVALLQPPAAGEGQQDD